MCRADVIIENSSFSKFFCILFPELMRKRFRKFGQKLEASFPKLLLTCPDERYQTKHFCLEIIVFGYQSLTFRDEIVNSGLFSVRVDSILLYVSLGTVSRKNHFFKTVLHFHPSHLTRKKSNLEEGFSEMLSELHSMFSEEPSQENLVCFGINYIFSSILEFNTKFTGTFSKIHKIYLHWFIFVECNVIAEVFFFERKYIPIF